MKAGKRENFGRKESGIDSNAAARKAAALWYSIGILRSGGVHAAIAFFPFLYFPIPVHTAAEAVAAEGSRCFTASCSMTLSVPARAIIASSLSA